MVVQRDQGLIHEITTSVSYVEKDKMLWVATYFGASRYDGRNWKALGLPPGQGPDRPGPPGPVELPAVAAAGRAAVVLGFCTAHAATIRDISLRTHYTWGSHREMTRKLLLAPRHTGGRLSKQIEGTLCGQAHSTHRRYRPPSGTAPKSSPRSANATWARCSPGSATTPDSARPASAPPPNSARAASARSSTAPAPSPPPTSSNASPTASTCPTTPGTTSAYHHCTPRPAPHQAPPREAGPARTPTCSGRSPPPAAS